jgi:hypothetical protein
MLVSGATVVVNEHRGHPNLGLLAVPKAGNAPEHYQGWRWAADNGAFDGFNESLFLRMLDKLSDVPGCLFLACPDVVADAAATLCLFEEWAPRLADWPLALVAQDGLTSDMVPWDQISCLFVGGSTTWKLGAEAAGLVDEANTRGKWTHMGRVNTFRRIDYALALNCDSIDGTNWSRYSRLRIPGGLRRLENEHLLLREVLH